MISKCKHRHIWLVQEVVKADYVDDFIHEYTQCRYCKEKLNIESIHKREIINDMRTKTDLTFDS